MLANSSGVKWKTIGKTRRAIGNNAETMLIVLRVLEPSQVIARDISVRQMPSNEAGYSHAGLPSWT